MINMFGRAGLYGYATATKIEALEIKFANGEIGHAKVLKRLWKLAGNSSETPEEALMTYLHWKSYYESTI